MNGATLFPHRVILIGVVFCLILAGGCADQKTLDANKQLNDQVSVLTQDRDQLKVDLAKARADTVAANTKAAAADTRLSQSDGKLAEAQASLQRCQDDFKTAQAKAAQLDQVLAELKIMQSKLLDAANDTKRLQTEAAAAHEAAAASSARADKLQLQFTALQEMKNTLDKELADLGQRLEQMHKPISAEPAPHHPEPAASPTTPATVPHVP